MSDVEYDTLAGVYDWLVPDQLLTPEGGVAAFAGSVVEGLRPGARVLDCAAGTGQLAVGLALRGFDVVATDASGAMIERTRRLAADRGATLRAEICAWEELAGQDLGGSFEAVLCVGNSLVHAAGAGARRAALAAMSALPAPGGVLVVTSRNWERVRREGSGLRIADRLVERDGRRGLVIYAWDIPDAPDDPHVLDVAVALLDDDDIVTTHRERMRFAPFTHEELDDELRAAGLVAESSTFADYCERYLVTARRPDGQARRV